PARVSQLHAQSAQSPSAVHQFLDLQRSVGNQAIQRLINSPYIQTKLQVSTPGDPYEQEADRVADTVMRMPDPVPAASIQRVPLAVRDDDEDEEKLAREVKASQEEQKTLVDQPNSNDKPLQLKSDDDEDKELPSEVHPQVQRATVNTAHIQRVISSNQRLPLQNTASQAAVQRLCKECDSEVQSGPAISDPP